jgi:adenylyl cyclase-associated protein
MALETSHRHILGRGAPLKFDEGDTVLTCMVRRLEAATSRLEDIASSSFPNGETPSSAVPTTVVTGESPKAANAAPKPPVESAPPAIEAFDGLVNAELKVWLALSAQLGDVITGQVRGRLGEHGNEKAA